MYVPAQAVGNAAVQAGGPSDGGTAEMARLRETAQAIQASEENGAVPGPVQAETTAAVQATPVSAKAVKVDLDADRAAKDGVIEYPITGPDKFARTIAEAKKVVYEEEQRAKKSEALDQVPKCAMRAPRLLKTIWSTSRKQRPPKPVWRPVARAWIVELRHRLPMTLRSLKTSVPRRLPLPWWLAKEPPKQPPTPLPKRAPTRTSRRHLAAALRLGHTCLAGTGWDDASVNRPGFRIAGDRSICRPRSARTRYGSALCCPYRGERKRLWSIAQGDCCHAGGGRRGLAVC